MLLERPGDGECPLFGILDGFWSVISNGFCIKLVEAERFCDFLSPSFSQNFEDITYLENSVFRSFLMGKRGGKNPNVRLYANALGVGGFFEKIPDEK